MTHLAPDRLVALAERAPSEVNDPHLARCERCRAEVDALRDAWRSVAEIEVPEPSSLFWAHLSRRVARAVEREPAPRAWWRVRWLGPVPLSAAAAAVVVVAASLWWWQPREGTAPERGARAAPAGEAATAAPFAAADDEVWQVVASLAEGVGMETVDATGIGPGPGRIEDAAWDMSDREREELIRLLRLETGDATGTEG